MHNRRSMKPIATQKSMGIIVAQWTLHGCPNGSEVSQCLPELLMLTSLLYTKSYIPLPLNRLYRLPFSNSAITMSLSVETVQGLFAPLVAGDSMSFFTSSVRCSHALPAFALKLSSD
jgi:hypothetical protein